MFPLIPAKILTFVGSGVAIGSSVIAQASQAINPNTPDALGTTVLTVGTGGLFVAIAAMFKDFWTYKKQQIESLERQAKEARESLERIETAKLAIERMRVTQAKSGRQTTMILRWMAEAHKTQSFPPPPPIVHEHDDGRAA